MAERPKWFDQRATVHADMLTDETYRKKQEAVRYALQLERDIAAKDRRIAELEALADNYKDALCSIAIYDQDDRPLEYTKDDPYDWRRRSMKQEGMARAACNGTWPPMPATKEPPHA